MKYYKKKVLLVLSILIFILVSSVYAEVKTKVGENKLEPGSLLINGVLIPYKAIPSLSGILVADCFTNKCADIAIGVNGEPVGIDFSKGIYGDGVVDTYDYTSFKTYNDICEGQDADYYEDIDFDGDGCIRTDEEDSDNRCMLEWLNKETDCSSGSGAQLAGAGEAVLQSALESRIRDSITSGRAYLDFCYSMDKNLNTWDNFISDVKNKKNSFDNFIQSLSGSQCTSSPQRISCSEEGNEIVLQAECPRFPGFIQDFYDIFSRNPELRFNKEVYKDYLKVVGYSCSASEFEGWNHHNFHELVANDLKFYSRFCNPTSPSWGETDCSKNYNGPEMECIIGLTNDLSYLREFCSPEEEFATKFRQGKIFLSGNSYDYVLKRWNSYWEDIKKNTLNFYKEYGGYNKCSTYGSRTWKPGNMTCKEEGDEIILQVKPKCYWFKTDLNPVNFGFPENTKELPLNFPEMRFSKWISGIPEYGVPKTEKIAKYSCVADEFEWGKDIGRDMAALGIIITGKDFSAVVQTDFGVHQNPYTCGFSMLAGSNTEFIISEELQQILNRPENKRVKEDINSVFSYISKNYDSDYGFSQYFVVGYDPGLETFAKFEPEGIISWNGGEDIGILKINPSKSSENRYIDQALIAEAWGQKEYMFELHEQNIHFLLNPAERSLHGLLTAADYTKNLESFGLPGIRLDLPFGIGSGKDMYSAELDLYSKLSAFVAAMEKNYNFEIEEYLNPYKNTGLGTIDLRDFSLSTIIIGNDEWANAYSNAYETTKTSAKASGLRVNWFNLLQGLASLKSLQTLVVSKLESLPNFYSAPTKPQEEFSDQLLRFTYAGLLRSGIRDFSEGEKGDIFVQVYPDGSKGFFKFDGALWWSINENDMTDNEKKKAKTIELAILNDPKVKENIRWISEKLGDYRLQQYFNTVEKYFYGAYKFMPPKEYTEQFVFPSPSIPHSSFYVLDVFGNLWSSDGLIIPGYDQPDDTPKEETDLINADVVDCNSGIGAIGGHCLTDEGDLGVCGKRGDNYVCSRIITGDTRAYKPVN